ncbi:MAG: hypothetical protein IH797_03515 [Chloroflexi bacterium]|nr:hypothetical protein [Chloroflexota bacterium]
MAIQTQGCKLNQADSDQLARHFTEAGFALVDLAGGADVIVVNTCTVTAAADAKARQALRAARRANPNALVVATGCYAQRAAKELELLEGVDLVTSMDQVSENGNLDDTPLTVITAGRSELPPFIDRDLGEQLTGSWLESQRELVRLSSAGVHVIAEESGHCIQCDQPVLVADVIRRMVEAVRR